MSESKSFGVKKYAKEPKMKLYSDGSAFTSIADDGLLTGPSVKTATQDEDASLLSDDENKTLITLEPPKKHTSREGGKPNVSALDLPKKKVDRNEAKNKVPTVTVVKTPATSSVQQKKPPSKTIITTHDLLKTLKEQTKSTKPPVLESKEAMLQKMRERLSKHIEIKSTSAATPATPPKPLDTSGAIEIPQDLILSSEIPPTPISAMESKETVLEDHDLIAILEGNDVEIRENATEIEVCVGAVESAESMKEMQIVILDQGEMQKAKIEREKEIARKQIENLPSHPKRRRTKAPSLEKVKTETGAEKVSSAVGANEVAKSAARATLNLPAGITIKGQTTIRPVESKAPTGGVTIREEKVTNEKVPKAPKRPAPVLIAGPAVKFPSPQTSPRSANKSSNLVDSLVSDWDDEPGGGSGQPVEEAKVEKVKAPPVDSKPATPMFTIPVEMAPKNTVGAAPPAAPVAEEPRRVIKKKIIWDPSDATIPFSVLVKSNRGNAAAATVQVPPKGNQTLRRRADSVAVHMIGQEGRTAATPKRALTPEPARQPSQADSRKELARETVVENNNIATDAKGGKKRKKNEIERLLADEGAINMLYDVECEANQTDLLKDTAVDTSDEDEKLLAKTKIITDAVINQGKSPTEGVTQQGLRVRAKRASTPLHHSTGYVDTPVVSAKSEATSAGTSPVATVPPPPAGTKKNTNGAATVGGGPPVGARKRKTPATLKDWDYVYNAQGGDDAMIIRRRSNSSYSSSCASPRRLSVDQSYESPNMASVAKSPPADDGFLFAKPTKPATTTTTAAAEPELMQFDPSLVANMRGKLSKALKSMKGGIEPVAEETVSKKASPATAPAVKSVAQMKRKVATKGAGPSSGPVEAMSSSVDYVVSPSGELIQQESALNKATEKRLDEMKQISWTRDGEYVELVLRTKGVVPAVIDDVAAMCNVFSKEAMTELTEVFTILNKESRVTAVLLMSAGDDFSRGLDVAHLLQPVNKRKEYAEEMAACLKLFLKSLISFTKPIVAAVHGNVLGMGVTILPAFDVVLAQTGSTFATPYGYFGYLPEAMKAFTNSRSLKPKAVTDLLLLGKRVTSAAALEYGLVTELISADRFTDRARALTKKLSSQSAQALQSIKQNMHREFLSRLDFVLSLEEKKHTQQWITPECQQKFKIFVGKGGELGKIP